MRKLAVIGSFVALLCVAACTSGDTKDAVKSGTTEKGSETTGPADSPEAGIAPGVTDETIKVGITYVDLKAIADVVTTDHGDYKATYQALVDDLNERGGINGRMVEPVFAPINPIGTQPGEEACVKLTEDDGVFLSMGFFNADTVLCFVDTHASAVVGGTMTPQRLDRAKAPWFTVQPGSDFQLDAIRKFDEDGLLDGKVAVYAIDNDLDFLDDEVKPLLEELGVDVVEFGVNDAPDGDLVAVDAKSKLIGEKFQSGDADTMLSVGTAGSTAADMLQMTQFRPKALFANINEVLSYVNDAAGNDLTVLEGAVAADFYGPKVDQYHEANMQKCLAVLDNHGIEVTEPLDGQVPKGTPQPFVSAVSACKDMTLVEALLKAAGKNLDYATLRAAGDEVGDLPMPASPEPYHYGSPPHADGDGPIFLYDFDVAGKAFERSDD